MIPTRIGQQCNGGTFTGFNRIQNHVYSIIVAPKSTETKLKQKLSGDNTLGTQSTIDGWANTAAMNDQTHPAAYYCRNLIVNGYSDWYLPSRNELELCYRYLKPCNFVNELNTLNVTTWHLQRKNGFNTSSIPVGHPYTVERPTRTVVTGYTCDNNQSFSNQWYWSSTALDSTTSTSAVKHFRRGEQSRDYKTVNRYKVRAVRREFVVTLNVL